jgi:hypothetical protein
LSTALKKPFILKFFCRARDAAQVVVHPSSKGEALEFKLQDLGPQNSFIYNVVPTGTPIYTSHLAEVTSVH